MPNINNFFPASGDWLKVADLQGRAIRATVSEVKPIQVPDFNDREKMLPALEIHFRGADKSFVCKKMNAENISVGYGPDTDAWIGKVVVLKPGRSSNGYDMIVAEPELEVSDGFAANQAGQTPVTGYIAQTVDPNMDHPTVPSDQIGNAPHEEDGFDSDIPF